MTAKKDVRYYAKFTVDYADHPKIAALSDRAFRALTEMILWSKRNMTDGHVPYEVCKRYGKNALKQLETLSPKNPSIIRTETGYFIHHFSEHQQTTADISVKAQAGRAGGLAKAANRKAASENVAFASPLLPENVANGVAKKVQEIKSAATPPATQREVLKNISAISDSRADVEGLCTLLADLITANGSMPPVITNRWRIDARLLLDKDGHTYPEAERLIRWCQADDFWRGNIMSMTKFRMQYDHLRLNAERPVRPVPSGGFSGPRRMTRHEENRARLGMGANPKPIDPGDDGIFRLDEAAP